MSEIDPGAAPDETEAITVVEAVEVVEVVEEFDALEAVEEIEQADAEQADARTDARLESLDDGSAAVSGAPSGHGAPAPEALPFTMSAREHFAAVDALESTGDARVDAATARLEEVPDLPTADHVEVYEDVHRRLQDALSEAEVR